jgi:tetratricopeptide (TPR) repeat protein
VRIEAELIDIRDGSEIWGDEYDRQLSEVEAIQRQIAREVGNKLRPNDTNEQSLNKQSTRNAEAYEAYLKGRYYWNKRTPEAFKKAIEFFTAATDKDPTYSLAWSGLADTYDLMSRYDVLSPQEAKPKAEAAALKAVQFDDSSAEAHTSLAAVRESGWEWAGAEKEYKRAIQLNDNYATAHHWYSDLLSMFGRLDDAVAEAQRAVQLDPLSLPINQNLGDVYSSLNYADALKQYRKTLTIDPNYAPTHTQLMLLYANRGKYEGAFTEMKESEIGVNDAERQKFSSELLNELHANGSQAALKDWIQLAIQKSKQTYIPPTSIADLYFMLGDKEHGFQWLELAYQGRDDYLAYVKVDPTIAPFRSDPRYADLLRRMGLPQ